MRKIKQILIALVLLPVFISCEDFLDEDLQGVYSSKTFYETPEQAITAVNATYVPASFREINNCLWVFGDVASDDAIKGGNPGDQSEIEFIDDFSVTPDNGFVEFIWQHYYEGISRANQVILNVPKINMNDDLRNRIVGEAKFLRAYYYFHLVNIYGSIPLKTKPALTSEALHVPLSSVEKIYSQIEKDLEDAAKVLPNQYGGTEKGRATKGAALGLLAKVYLFQEKWQKVITTTNQVQDLIMYELLDVYRHNFELAYDNNDESIIEFQHNKGETPYEGSYLNQWFSPKKENGYYFNTPTEDLVNAYEVTNEGIADPRLDYSIGREGGQWLNGEDFDPAWSPTGFLTKKHAQPLEEVSAGTKGDAGLNYTYMRYAEILLMKAEALNEDGRSADALEPLNKIRKRARECYLHDDTLTGYGSVPQGLLSDITVTNQQTVRDVIRHERRVELAMEFHRYFDLMRYGAEAAEAALSNKGFIYAEDRYFPIPQSERDANNAL